MNSVVATGSRLNGGTAINANVFAPAATLAIKEDIVSLSGGVLGSTAAQFTIRYSHRSGIDVSTLDDNALIVTRQWGPAD